MVKKGGGCANRLKNKSPGHSLPGDFQPKPYHNCKCFALTYILTQFFIQLYNVLLKLTRK
jgi:hypothetical protein